MKCAAAGDTLACMLVKITVEVQGKPVPLDRVRDAQVRAALSKLASDIGRKLDTVTCAEHNRGPKDVRVHVGARGDADIKYDSCCERLRGAVGAALG